MSRFYIAEQEKPVTDKMFPSTVWPSLVQSRLTKCWCSVASLASLNYIFRDTIMFFWNNKNFLLYISFVSHSERMLSVAQSCHSPWLDTSLLQSSRKQQLCTTQNLVQKSNIYNGNHQNTLELTWLIQITAWRTNY